MSDELATAKHRDAISEPEYLIEAMRDEDDGKALGVKVLDQALDVGRLPHAERRGRFVK